MLVGVWTPTPTHVLQAHLIEKQDRTVEFFDRVCLINIKGRDICIEYRELYREQTVT